MTVNGKGYTIKDMATLFGVFGKSKTDAFGTMRRITDLFANEFGTPEAVIEKNHVVKYFDRDRVDGLIRRWRELPDVSGENSTTRFRRLFNKPSRSGQNIAAALAARGVRRSSDSQVVELLMEIRDRVKSLENMWTTK